jgi:hypothetical protein
MSNPSFLKVYLQYHKKLNHKLFDGEVLLQDVRNILLKNAYEWMKFAAIPKEYVSDIIFTGGAAQYNYTKYSDLDVHIVFDKKQFKLDPEMLDDHFADKKILWTLTHHIKVKGYPVEMYAQDSNDHLVASGVYSLLHNVWVKKPIKGNYDFKHDTILRDKVESYIEMIDNMIKDKFPVIEFKKLKEKFRDMRKSALLTGDEFSFDNLVYKSLRNNGALDRMNKYVQNQRDKKLSLENFIVDIES